MGSTTKTTPKSGNLDLPAERNGTEVSVPFRSVPFRRNGTERNGKWNGTERNGRGLKSGGTERNGTDGTETSLVFSVIYFF